MKRAITLATALGLASMASASWADASPELAAQGRAIIKKAHCTACHAVDQKRVGPPYQDIAAKYKDEKDKKAIEETLFTKVREGGSGVWGEISMIPNDETKISDADLHTVLKWVLEGAN